MMSPKPWYRRKGAPWIFLGGMLVIGAIGFLFVGVLGVATPIDTPANDAVIAFGVVWTILGFMVTPLSIAGAIIWAVLIRTKPDPAMQQAKAAEKTAARQATEAAKKLRAQSAADDRAKRASEKQAAREAARLRELEARAERERAKEVAEREKRAKDAEAARKRAKATLARPTTPTFDAVQVAYLNGLEPKNHWQVYTFGWPFPEPPTVGDYVVVSGGTLTKIMALGRGDWGGSLTPVERIATPKDIARAGRGRGKVRFQ